MSGFPPPVPAGFPADMPRKTVDLHIVTETPQGKNTQVKYNLICVVYQRNDGDGVDDCEWHEIGRTEMILHGCTPAFETPIRIEYMCGIEQTIKVELCTISQFTMKLRIPMLLGSIEFPLSKVLSSPGGIFYDNLVIPGPQNVCIPMTIIADEVNTSDGVCFSLAGTHLDKKDLLGKSDPYIKIMREFVGRRVTVHRTEPIHQTLDPMWSEFTMSLHELCGCKYDEKIIFECWDWDKTGPGDFIGECSISFNEIQRNAGPFSLPLIDPKKTGKKGYKNSGELIFNLHSMVRYYSFNDYVIGGGCELNFITAVDFTPSNGNPTKKVFLHNPSESPNPYEKTIETVGNILLSRNHAKTVSFYGYGTQTTVKGQNSLLFSLSGNPEDPTVHDIQSVLDAYRRALMERCLGYNNHIAPVIEQVMKMVEANLGAPGSRYFVLLLLTPGSPDDQKEIMSAITHAANNLPLSIVFVGTGPAPFGTMDDILDRGKPVYDCDKHIFPVRNIVQSVPFATFEKSPEILERMIFTEISSQLCSFMNSHHVPPAFASMGVPLQAGYPQPIPYQQ